MYYKYQENHNKLCLCINIDRLSRKKWVFHTLTTFKFKIKTTTYMALLITCKRTVPNILLYIFIFIVYWIHNGIICLVFDLTACFTQNAYMGTQFWYTKLSLSEIASKTPLLYYCTLYLLSVNNLLSRLQVCFNQIKQKNSFHFTVIISRHK